MRVENTVVETYKATVQLIESTLPLSPGLRTADFPLRNIADPSLELAQKPEVGWPVHCLVVALQ